MPEPIARDLEPTVLIADALAFRREGILSLLHEWAEMHAVSLFSSALPDQVEADDAVASCRLCVLSVGSLSLENERAVEWLGRMKQRFPTAPIVVLSDRAEPIEALSAFRQGACGFVPTSMEPDAVMQALSFIMNGGTFFPPEALLSYTPNEVTLEAGMTRKQPEKRSGSNGIGDIGHPSFDDDADQAAFGALWSATARSVIWLDFSIPRIPPAREMETDDPSRSAVVLAFRQGNGEA